MQAIQFSPADSFQFVDLASPNLAPGEVRLRVDACGVCGSDRQVVQGESVPPGTNFPLVMGHEIAGTVIEIGPDVAAAGEIAVGDGVIVHPFISCGTCAPCRHGQENLCVRQVCIGYHQPGGFAEEVTVPAAQLVARPGLCSPQAAALLVDAYATPYHALKLSGVDPAATVLVIGTGGLGLAALQLLRALGVHAVGAVTRRAAGIELASAHGAQMVVSTEEDARAIARQMRRWSGASGIDVVIDTVATDETVALGLDMVRPGGTVTLVGMSEASASYPIAKSVRRGIRLLASYGSILSDVRELVGMVDDGAFDPATLIAGTLSLADVPQAFSPSRTSGRWVVVP